MGNFFADVVLGMLFLIAIWMILAISCKIIELIWLCLFNCFSPYLCPRRHREPWPVELCNCIVYSCIFTTEYCSICCININRKLRKCNRKMKLCKINIKKHVSKFRVQPIIYDDVHIIVINPYDNYQIATVSKKLNV
jgi:hypothetical protein